MKHGDKAKAKAAKAASKTSSKSSKASAAKASRKAGANLKSSKHQTHAKTSPAKTSSKPAGGNGNPKGRGPVAALGFSNPLVASAFKRAIKKFPTAFRRLTD